MKKVAAWALCVLWMMVIFMMSEMSGDVSGAQSGFVTELVERALAFVLGAQTAARIPTDTLELVIRKGAHMGEYAILFWLWAHALGLSGAKRPAVTALAVCAAYAASDEFHQCFDDRHRRRVDCAGASGGGAAHRARKGGKKAVTDYKIGEVARLLGLTTQALRFYEQEGVVTPKKSENGTRYYDEDQLILLLSFKKYRQADFSVQDIVTHFFKEDDLSGLRGQTLARRDMLLEQSALLRRRAEAFGAFEARLAYAQRHLDEPTLCERPLLHMLSPSLSELDFVDFKSRDSLEQFIAAMPDTRISFARKSAPGSERDFRLCANDEACAAWNLPLAHTRPLTPARCIRLIHRFACQPWDDEAMPELTAIGRKAGYAIAEDQPYLGLHLATENHQEHIYFYATFYLPVLEG